MLLLGIFNLGETIAEAFFGILLAIDGVIYGFIDKLYQLFMALASARILSNETIQSLLERVSILLGVCALFILAYSLLTAIINPDNMAKEKTGPYNIVKNIVIALAFLALTPAVFNFMYKFQDVVLGSNILGNIILKPSSENESVDFGEVSVDDGEGNINSYKPDTVTTSATEAVYQNGGRNMAFSMFVPFFRPSDGFSADDIKVAKSDYFLSEGLSGVATLACAATVAVGVGSMIVTSGVSGTVVGVGIVSCGAALIDAAADWIAELVDGDMSLTEAYRYALATGDFGIFSAFAGEAVAGKISYTLIISTIVGLLALYVIFSFCIDLAIRAAKLAYLQMIAPIPILFKVVPKGDKIFSNWIQKVASTFAEVFIRIIIIFFVVFIISEFKFAEDFWAGSYIGSPSETIQFFAQVFIILGLLLFAKQAPKLLTEMLGIKSAGIKLGIREKLAEGGVMRGGAALGAGVQTAIRNFNNQKGFRRFTSALGGFGGGAVGGFVGSKDAKTFSAMRKAKDDAVRKAEAKRDQRINYRNQVAAAAESEHKSAAQVRFEDAMQGARRWMGLESDKLDVYDKFIAQQDKLDAATDKVMSKMGNNASIVAAMTTDKWKGNSTQQQSYQRIYDKLRGNSFDAMDSYLSYLKNMDRSAILANKLNGETDEDAIIRHNREVADTSTMIAQLKKQSRINLQDVAFKGDADLAAMGLKSSDLADVRSEIGLYNDILREGGISFTVKNRDASGNPTGGTIETNTLDSRFFGTSADDITSAVKEQRNNIRVEEERRKRRQQNDGSSKK